MNYLRQEKSLRDHEPHLESLAAIAGLGIARQGGRLRRTALSAGSEAGQEWRERPAAGQGRRRGPQGCDQIPLYRATLSDAARNARLRRIHNSPRTQYWRPE